MSDIRTNPGDSPRQLAGCFCWPALLVLLSLAGCATKPEKLGFTDLGANTPVSHHHLVFSRDGRFLASINRLRDSVVVFDTGTGNEAWHFRPKEVKTLQQAGQLPRKSGLAGVAFTPEDRLVAVGWLKKNQIGLWDASGSNFVAQLVSPKGSWCLALSPDGRQLASEGTNNNVLVRALTNLDAVVEFPAQESRPHIVFFSEKGNYLAALDGKARPCIWTSKTGEPLPKPAPLDDRRVWSLAFSPDDQMVALSGKDLEIWRIDPWTNTLQIVSPKMKVGSRVAGAFLMALAAFGGQVVVTEAAMGPQPAGAAVFSPDGRYLAVINSAASLGNALGAPEMLVRVIDVNTGESLSTLRFGNQVASLAFSPDGNRLATAGHGVQVWDWRLQRLLPRE